MSFAIVLFWYVPNKEYWSSESDVLFCCAKKSNPFRKSIAGVIKCWISWRLVLLWIQRLYEYFLVSLSHWAIRILNILEFDNILNLLSISTSNASKFRYSWLSSGWKMSETNKVGKHLFKIKMFVRLTVFQKFFVI